MRRCHLENGITAVFAPHGHVLTVGSSDVKMAQKRRWVDQVLEACRLRGPNCGLESEEADFEDVSTGSRLLQLIFSSRPRRACSIRSARRDNGGGRRGQAGLTGRGAVWRLALFTLIELTEAICSYVSSQSTEATS